MKRRRKKVLCESVELLGIPHYFQGEADGLCVYYAMSMMIAALRPSHGPTIHDVPRYTWKGSPVFQVLKKICRSEKKFKQKIADWFFNGMKMREAVSVLNRVFEGETDDPPFELYCVRARRARHLKHNPKKRKILKKKTVKDIRYALSWHRPVLVAGGGFSGHAVLAIGYSGKEGKPDRICILDPSEMRPQWYATATIFTDDCEVIMPSPGCFTEYRPSRIITEGKAKPRLDPWANGDAEDERKAYRM